ncbi:MAG TPA: hypothetical protein VLL27_03510 [Solirubrobacterales bacterium]|nr:hypothetical protein [Solirubrobacterales bacterium]
MPSDDAEIHELRPMREKSVSDRFGRGGWDRPELVRSERDHNRAAAQRMAANEAARCLPGLRRAASDAQLAQQVRSMAAFAGDAETERQLKEALQELASAAAV